MKTKQRLLSIITAAVLSIVLITGSTALNAAETVISPVAPMDNNGVKWRVAYTETDPFVNYAGTLYYLIKGLERIGWITSTEGIPYKIGQEETLSMWTWLADRDMGSYLEFVKDGHYSLIDMGDDGDKVIVNRLKQNKDIDLMIVMGTSSGQKIATLDHNVRTMVFSSSNAVSSKIIQSEMDSGIDHVWAHMDTGRFIRQLQVFHDIFSFKTVGIAYEDSDLGRVFSAIDDVETVGKERGFSVKSAFVKEPVNEQDRERYYTDVLAAHTQLASEVDAFYLSSGRWDRALLPKLLEPFLEKNIPVFSQQGSAEVSYGALLSLYRANFSGIGHFGAENIARTLKGTKLRDLPQVFGDTPSIVINLATADRIGYLTPFDILLAADEIFTTIRGAN